MGEGSNGSFAAFGRDAGLKAPTGRTGQRSYAGDKVGVV